MGRYSECVVLFKTIDEKCLLCGWVKNASNGMAYCGVSYHNSRIFVTDLQ